MASDTCSAPGCDRPVHAGGLCGRCTMRLRRHGSVAGPPSAEERFWALVDAQGPLADVRPALGACSLWRGSVTSRGVPRFWADGRWGSAARFAWGLAWGSAVPYGLRVEHFACSHSWCVNSDHVRPKVGLDSILGHRNLAAWNARHSACVMGHLFTRRNTLKVPGGIACRECRGDVARARRNPGAMAGALSL